MKRNELLSWLTGFGLLLSGIHATAEETAVVRGGRINVRGQPSLIGEVITQLQKGEKVVVLEEITLDKPRTNEPAKWARIQMPANTPVWVFAPFIDPANKTVKVSRLNLRGGPGENYSVVGRLERGAPVRAIRQVEDWMEIETPPGAYGFVAANLLTRSTSMAGQTSTPARQETAAPLPTITPAPEPVAQSQPSPILLPGTSAVQQQPTVQAQPPGQMPSTVRAQPPIQKQPVVQNQPTVRNQALEAQWRPVSPARQAASTQPAPSTVATQPMTATGLATEKLPSTTASSNAQQPAATQLPTAPAPQELRNPDAVTMTRTPKADNDSERRIVRREGLVRSTISIQAPTYYELLSPATRKTVNYLHTERLGLDLKSYRGQRIVVTGEEAIDPRWPRTPVIEVETLELLP